MGTPVRESDLHVVLVAVAPDQQRLDAALDRARETYSNMPGIKAIWRQDCHALETEKEPFGFRDGISHPAIEGSGIPGTNPQEAPFKAGEFVLGYGDEMRGVQTTVPDVLGRNGTYVAFRKLHQRVAGFRQYLKANSTTVDAEELLAAKMMGRWRSGAPLALCPIHDDAALGADPQRNNKFLFEADDPAGLKTPGGSHMRRCNPRDATIAGVGRIHRMIRRGTAYGPALPKASWWTTEQIAESSSRLLVPASAGSSSSSSHSGLTTASSLAPTTIEIRYADRMTSILAFRENRYDDVCKAFPGL